VIKLKLTDIEATSLEDAALGNNYLYKDIELDLTKKRTFTRAINATDYLSDVNSIFDIEAVKNSIVTCFTTAPGQKILNPEFGLDLRMYLFEPISENTAFFIRDDIFNNLSRFEPRVVVSNVAVIPDIDNQLYEIYLQIDIPQLNIYGVSIKNTLNSEGYI
jgi:phage baseplate assembly protein W